MKWLLTHGIPSVKIFETASNLDGFKEWMQKEHRRELSGKLLQGYKFFLDAAFFQIFESIPSGKDIGIREDLLLKSAEEASFYIYKIPATCEKTKLLKNIFRIYEPVLASNEYSGLNEAILHFKKEVITPLNDIFNNCFRFKKNTKFTQDEAIKFNTADILYLYFHQVKAYGPIASWRPYILGKNVGRKNVDKYLEGFAFTIEYVWYNILGEKLFRKTSLKNIHPSDKWDGYNYNEPAPDVMTIQYAISRTFDLEKQTCFDSYFYRLREEIFWPWEKKHDEHINNWGDYYTITNKSFVKKAFGKLLAKKTTPLIKLNREETLDMQLFWQEVEVILNLDPYNFYGVTTFITLLAGAGALFNRRKGLDKIYVNKYISPIEYKSGQDISYAILIDSRKTNGHAKLGWHLFYHSTRDHTPNESSEVEKLLKSLKKRNILELNEIKISNKELKEYIVKYISNHRNESFLKEQNPNLESKEIIPDIETIKASFDKKDEFDLVQYSKGLIFELISYYIATKHYSKQYVKIDWSLYPKHSPGEMDVILCSKDEAFLIDCKLDINNHDVLKLHEKAKEKLEFSYPGKKHKIEFWSWFEASPENQAIFNNLKIDCNCLSSDKKLKFYNHIRIPKIGPILNHIY